jgi:enterochelin esterase-like enzyme
MDAADIVQESTRVRTCLTSRKNGQVCSNDAHKEYASRHAKMTCMPMLPVCRALACLGLLPLSWSAVTTAQSQVTAQSKGTAQSQVTAQSKVTANAQQKPCASTVLGELHVSTFTSKTFSDTQTLRVWLPPGYHDAANAQRAYPVLYMLDGQNLFDVCTASYGKEWRIDETLTELIAAKKVQPILVVGIDSSKTRRADEFLPMASPDDPDAEPEGKLYPELLTNEVMPEIAKSYRVMSGREHTAIGGSSYGGVAALYTLLTRPNVFGLGLLESTSLQVGNGEMLRETVDVMVPPLRVAIGVGTNETGVNPQGYRRAGFDPDAVNKGFVEASQRMAENFRNALGGRCEVYFTAAEGAEHDELAWAKRFPAAVEFLFPVQSAQQTTLRRP